MFAPKVSIVGALPIPDKDLAVSVNVTGAAAVAGFIQPQSEVAVFVTYTAAGGAGGVGKATKLLFPRILVLATSAAPPNTLNAANGAGGQITLALTQQQAEQLILASQTASLYLGLLSDTSVTNTDNGVSFNGKYVPVKLG
jgi:pilus assembly protein CpaB